MALARAMIPAPKFGFLPMRRSLS